MHSIASTWPIWKNQEVILNSQNHLRYFYIPHNDQVYKTGYKEWLFYKIHAQLWSTIFWNTKFSFYFSYNYWTTAYMWDWRGGGIHLGDVFFLRDKGVPNIQIFRIYNFISKYMFIKQKRKVNHNIGLWQTVLNVSPSILFLYGKKY